MLFTFQNDTIDCEDTFLINYHKTVTGITYAGCQRICLAIRPIFDAGDRCLRCGNAVRFSHRTTSTQE